ncbi:MULTISPECIES: helix-turn-helix transcriptional regulator [unclassified Amycolatopsis]|uniref:helix-turn-helix domain-containing protein n=1 Tax=unclassified Amycolatopsis TaxID=2618356 RepID=UPI001C6A1B67|nr:helix-turn-helix transcriptional regulator [Amycolatopsis sp. DSM 110486]QYN17111.1 helix-turn-helix domain-containing protein [Amycolatopsis sp. DSM 110486]
MPSTRATPRQVELGVLLRRIRKRAGLTQPQVAELVNRSHSHISRRERGELGFEEQSELERTLTVTGATSEETSQALRLFRDGTDPNWLIPGIARDLAVVAEYESVANDIFAYQPSLIPGPLQIRDYTRVMMVDGDMPETELDSKLELRMARRKRYLDGSTRFETVIGEQAIRYPACPPEVAVRQLRDLCEVAELPHISIQLLPFRLGYHPAREGGFVVIRSDSATVVHVEQYRSSTTLTNTRDVKDYVEAADRIRRDAMGAVASVRAIAKIADELERTG